MKNTKKWMAVLLCGLMLLVSAACSQEEKNPKASDVVDELRAELSFLKWQPERGKPCSVRLRSDGGRR